MTANQTFLRGIHAFVDVSSSEQRTELMDTLEGMGAKVTMTFVLIEDFPLY